MKKVYYILFTVMLLCLACDYQFKSGGDEAEMSALQIRRYDRLECRYLTTGDYSALQQMNTEYPMETRTLVEDILKLGQVYEPDINSRFLGFYQDTLLQVVISDVEAEYANMDDLNKQLQDAFGRLLKWIPELPVPEVYAQIGAFAQSIVIGDGTIGISLDKYMGEDYQPYQRYYNSDQRRTMTRSYIVPDCLCFYLLSMYPLKNFDFRTQQERDIHMAKVMWVVNQAVGKSCFNSTYIKQIETYTKKHPKISHQQLLESASLKNL